MNITQYRIKHCDTKHLEFQYNVTIFALLFERLEVIRNFGKDYIKFPEIFCQYFLQIFQLASLSVSIIYCGSE